MDMHTKYQQVCNMYQIKLAEVKEMHIHDQTVVKEL